MTHQLENSIAAISEQHGLESVSITLFTPQDLDRMWFQVGVQWIDPCGRGIANGSNPDSIAQALGDALAEMHAKRGTSEPVALADVALVAEAGA